MNLKSLVYFITLLFVVSCSGKKEEESKEKSAKLQKKGAKKDAPKKASKDAPKDAPKKASKDAPKDAPKTKNADAEVVEAVVTEVEGEVEYSEGNADDFSALKKDMELYAEDSIRVKKGMARIRLWDDSTVVVSENSEVILNGTSDLVNGSPSVTIVYGNANLLIEPRSEGQDLFKVYSPSAILSVLGTEFEVGVADSGKVRVGVEDGTVSVSDPAGNKSLNIDKGKQTVIDLNGKFKTPSSFDPEKNSLAKWQVQQMAEAQKKASEIVKVTSKRLEELKTQMDKYKEAVAKLEKKSKELSEKAQELEKANKPEEYQKHQDELSNVMEDSSEAVGVEEKLNALVTANTYLYKRMNGLIKAGVIKPSKRDMKVISTVRTNTDKWLPSFYDNSLSRRQRWHRRRRHWKKRYLRHHPKGRYYASQTGVKLPEFYKNLKVRKIRRRRRRKNKYLKGIKYRTRRHLKYKGKRRSARRRRRRNWNKNRNFKTHRKNYNKRMERLKKRLRRRRRNDKRKFVDVPRFKNKHRRNRRGMKRPDRRVRRNRRGMKPGDRRNRLGMDRRNRGKKVLSKPDYAIDKNKLRGKRNRKDDKAEGRRRRRNRKDDKAEGRRRRRNRKDDKAESRRRRRNRKDPMRKIHRKRRVRRNRKKDE